MDSGFRTDGQIRVALIGYGWWGKNIARNLDALGALYCICDTNDKSRAVAGKLYPHAMVYSRLEQVLEDEKVSCVCIATPAVTHAAIALDVLSSGRDVFVEKPLSTNIADGLKVVRTAHRYEKVLMVGHILRYHPAIEKLKKIVDEGKLGELRYIYSNRLNLGKVRKEENILWSFAPHDIDIIIHLSGRVPRMVLAVGASYLQPRIADTTLSYMFFDGNFHAHIYVSWLHPFKDQKLVVVGSEAMAVFDDVKKSGKLVIMDGRVEKGEDGQLLVVKSDKCAISISDDEPLRVELVHFLECVRERKKPKTDGMVALKVISVLEACQRSMLGGGKLENVQRVWL